MALHKNVASASARTHWFFVENTTERVNRWPEWKREVVNSAFSAPKPIAQSTNVVSEPEPKKE